MAQVHEVPDERPGRSKYSRLPDPIPLERTVTTSEATALPEETDDYWREVEWMLRVAGGA